MEEEVVVEEVVEEVVGAEYDVWLEAEAVVSVEAAVAVGQTLELTGYYPRDLYSYWEL